jgi:hypothetical protein
MNLLGWKIRNYLEKAMKVNRNLPFLYLAPKVHKVLKPEDPLTARTITPAHKWITAASSKYIAQSINEQLEKHEQILEDSTELINIR